MTLLVLSLYAFESFSPKNTLNSCVQSAELQCSETIDKNFDFTRMVDSISSNHIMQRQSVISDDPAVVERINNKDKSAFNELYNRYSQLVYNLAYRILKDREDAEETVQETFLQIWNKVGSYQSDRGAVSTWIINIARSRSIDKLRTLKYRNKNTELDEEKVNSSINLTDIIEQRDERKAVFQKAMQALPEKQRIALEMVYFEGYTHIETAEKLNEPLGTIKTRIRLGVSKLKDTILPYLKELNE